MAVALSPADAEALWETAERTEIATMIENGVIRAGTTIPPEDYMLPRELGGLYR